MESSQALQLCEINSDGFSKLKSAPLCQVCGAENAKSAYGTQSCASCKIFFRRNADLDSKTNECKFDEKCSITIKNRHMCRYCRLKKCLSVGMKKDLLRAAHGAQGGTKMKQKLLRKQTNLNENVRSSSITIHPIDLLNHDRSLLTIDQWSLLSNVTNTYNNRSPVENIIHLLSNHSLFPHKIRLKLANSHLMDILRSMYICTESFINIIPEISYMKINDRNALISRNIQNLGGINCQFMMRETKILKDFAYANSLSSTYGSWLFNSTVQIAGNLDIDGTLLKLLIVILAFSTCSDIVFPIYTSNEKSNKSNETSYLSIDTKYLLEIQNKYVEVMFKYMIYRCGYYQAALRFASIMKNFLFQSILTANATQISKHDQMIRTVVDKTEQLFISENQC